MKKLLLFSLLILLVPIISFANNGEEDGKKKKKSDAIRTERQVALSAESGWRTLSGVGINASYYFSPRIAGDIGLGLSYMGVKSGIRGRILFSENNFAPYVGVGLNYAAGSLDNIEIEDTETLITYVYDTSPSIFGQVVFGFEYMSNGGFYIGWNIGYAPSLNENYEFQSPPSELIDTTVKLLYGNSISTALNIGYAF